MESTESTGHDGGQTAPASAEPLTRQLLRIVTAARTRQDEPGLHGTREDRVAHALDSITAMELVSAWHRRGTEVGFPELMTRPAPTRRRSLCSCHRENRTS
ncbi:hypothetical protein ABTZ21_32470 [Streptomyces sp. NPDC096191]|uniref:hypothetical protein n=1 Tax=Streptomyces sp. NPDC096191 TaxID=3155426 RepID=UPI00332DB12C